MENWRIMDASSSCVRCILTVDAHSPRCYISVIRQGDMSMVKEMFSKVASYKTEALIKAVKSLKVSSQEDRMVRGVMLGEIEKRKGEVFTDSLMSEIGM